MYLRQIFNRIGLWPSAKRAPELPHLMNFAPTEHQLNWPSMVHVIGVIRSSQFIHRLKYTCRMLQASSARRSFMRYLSADAAWQSLFSLNQRCYYVPFRLYLDRRWSQKKRFEQCATDLRVAETKFGLTLAQQLSDGQRVRLSEQASVSVDLELNRISFHEGFWSLSMKDSQGQALFNMSFGFLSQHAVLVASVQGVRADSDGNLEAIQSITKQNHGLRPHHLLLNIFQLACADWGITEIRGIDPDHQVKKRRNADKQGFTFDYRAFWAELGAVQLDDQDWLLPSQPQRRAAEDIPARKRALYRKRYAFLDDLAGVVATSLANATSAKTNADASITDPAKLATSVFA